MVSVSTMLVQAKSNPTFAHELVSRTPQLVRSTCARCGTFIFGRDSDGSLERWQREHKCDKSIARPTPLGRLRSWLHH